MKNNYGAYPLIVRQNLSTLYNFIHKQFGIMNKVFLNLACLVFIILCFDMKLKNIYLCSVGDSRQWIFISAWLKSLSNFRSHLARGEAFFIPGSSQVLAIPNSDCKVKKQLSIFPNTLATKSVSPDLTVSTYDLQVQKTLWLITHRGCAGQERNGMKRG
jgi:hypothetical protein